MTYLDSVTWGETAFLAVRRAGGLKPLVHRINSVLGSWIGSRNTFGKVFLLDEAPSQADAEDDRFRAWLLLTAAGEDPLKWGLTHDVLPPAWQADEQRERLRSLIAPTVGSSYDEGSATRVLLNAAGSGVFSFA